MTPCNRLPAYGPPPRRAAGSVLPVLALELALVLALAGCAGSPPRPAGGNPTAVPPAPRPPAVAQPGRDGPDANPPPDLHRVPDAQPRLEPVRPGGPNKPYEVLGQFYTPLAGDPPLVERGLASWYGRKFHGRNTANGETYNMYAMTAAHKTMPLPSYARVRNPANGREVLVRVNDRGPFHSDRVIDLSYTAALKLGLLGGVATVEVERITYEAIRTGAWRLPAGSGTALALALAEPTLDALLPPAPPADPIADIARRSAGRPVGLPAGQPVGPLVTAEATAPPLPTPLPSSMPSSLSIPLSAPLPAPLPAETAAPARAAAKSAPGFWLQLGAFSQRDGAVGFQQRVAKEADWLSPLMAIFNERNLHRLQAGPYASRADASHAAERLRAALQLVPAIVERR